MSNKTLDDYEYSGDKPYTCEELLREQYVDNELTAIELAEFCDCGKTTILRYLEKFGIERRDRGPDGDFPWEGPEQIRHMYWEEGMSTVAIAEEFGCNAGDVTQYMRVRDIPRRSRSEANELRFGSVEERFWNNVDKGGKDECWEWQASTVAGYGQMGVDNGTGRAHRISYEIHKGDIPEGLHILHHCDNPPCVNPAHLYAGTVRDNMHDRYERDRHPKPMGPGEGNWKAKLTREDVLDILQRADQESVLQKDLAEEYGVYPNTISRIVRGEGWTNVYEEYHNSDSIE